MSSYRPSIKSDANGNTVDLPLDAETVKGKEVLATDGSVSMKGSLEFSQSGDSGVKGIVFNVATNDYARIVGGATANNTGYLELATADDGSEPIYVRQYSNGKFVTLARTAILLDAKGNTSFPGTVSSGGQLLVKTNDSRLSDARPASDVYAWAKASSKPSYSPSEIIPYYSGAKPSWANSAISGLTTLFGWDTSVSGDSNIVACSSSGQVNVVIDGEFYAKEGQNKVYHGGNLTFSLSGTTLTITKS